MAWYKRKQIENVHDAIEDSVSQINSYMNDNHVADSQSLNDLKANITTVNVTEHLGVVENTLNLLTEVKKLLELEQKCRMNASLLNEMDKKDQVKKQQVMKRKVCVSNRASPYEMFNQPTRASTSSKTSSLTSSPKRSTSKGRKLPKIPARSNNTEEPMTQGSSQDSS